jgi:hypothetical protein
MALPRGYTHGDDVTVAFTRDGTGIVVAEAYGSAGSAILIWRSADGGRRFGPAAVVYRATGPRNTDHPWVATDPASEAVYLAWSFGPALLFSRSLDGGRTFSPARTISGPGDARPGWAVVTAGPAGAVQVVYVDEVRSAPFEVVRSTDQGRTFGAPVGPAGGPIQDGSPQLSVSTLLAAATDPRTGTIYVARAAPTGAGKLAIQLWRGTGGGGAWTAPAAVAPGTQADQFQPQLAVDESGAVYISYFAYQSGRVGLYLARSPAGGARFGPSLAVTSASFDPALGLRGGKGGPWWIGDYQGLTTGGGMVYPLWSDTRTGQLEIFGASVAATALPGRG